MDYLVTLTPDDNDTFLVTFPDVAGDVTFGDTIEEALARAPEALATIPGGGQPGPPADSAALDPPARNIA